jgi:hypothetical protein
MRRRRGGGGGGEGEAGSRRRRAAETEMAGEEGARGVVIGRGLTPVKILPTASKICPRHNPTTTCKGVLTTV